MNVFQYYRPLHMFPYPYKWLIGAGFFFYIKNQFQPTNGVVYHKKLWFLFLPAVLYGFLRTYWFAIAVQENSFRITRVIVDSEFFRVHEFFYQFFTIALLFASLKLIKKHERTITTTKRTDPVFHWLKKITVFFIAIMLLDITLYSIDLILHNFKETIKFSYPTFVLNSVFIYWIGYMGFTKPKVFFNTLKKKGTFSETPQNEVVLKIENAIKAEIYTNSNLTLAEMASDLDISAKEASRYINEVYQMNFSEFLNFHRVEKVKKLLASEDAKKYTLVTLAEEAGFSSKSSFNASFKKVVGMTPSAYRKHI